MQIEEVTSDPNFLVDYANLLNILSRTRLLEYLRTSGLSYLTLPYKDGTEAAMNAARTQGWQDCLNQLEVFKQLLSSEHVLKTELPRADFGSLERLHESGELSQEEKEALANGKLPDYSEFIKPVANARSTAVNPTKR